MESFQKRFLQAKEISGLRWIDIANKSGLDKASISQYKNGVHIPEQDALYKLASALNVSMEWLSGADVPMETRKITIEDSEILNCYHKLNSTGRVEFMRFLDDLLSNDEYAR